MLEIIFGNVVEVTLASSVVIILLLALSKVLNKNFTAKWRYWLWLTIAIRLVLPFNITLASPPVQLVPLTTMQLVSEEMTAASESIFTLDSSMTMKAAENKNTQASIVNPAKVGSLDFTRILLIIWIAGASLFMAWQLISYALFLRYAKSRCTPVIQQNFLSKYQEICNEMKISQKIPLMICKSISSPLVLGIWKQMLLLPDVAFTPQQLKMVLCHELVHVKRRDILYKSLFLLARAMHWFNPLVHLMAIEANKDVEVSCDATVVNNQNAEFRKDYSMAILQVIHNSRKSQVVFSTHFRGGKMVFMKRLESLFDMQKKRKGLLPFILIILVIGIIGLCISCNQNPPTTAAPETIATTTATIATTTTAETTAGSDPKLIGKWVAVDPVIIVGLPVKNIEFFPDGKAIIADADQATYKIVNGKLQCSVEGSVYTGDYEIDGTKLTIYKDNGEFKVYIKER